MVTKIWVSVGSGHELLPDSIKSLLVPRQWVPLALITQILQEMPNSLILKVCLKIAHLAYQPYLLVDNELKCPGTTKEWS